MIVIGVIGILAGGLIALVNPVAQMQKSRDAKVKSNLKQIQVALELFRADCGTYPAPVGANNIPSPLTTDSCPGYSGASVTYMQTVPGYPSGSEWAGGSFYYQNIGAGTERYSISACLENINAQEVNDGEMEIREHDPCGTVGGETRKVLIVNSP